MGVLGIQLVGTSRLFRRVGVPLASMLSPLVYFLGFFGLGVRLDLTVGIGAVVGRFSRTTPSTTRRRRCWSRFFPSRFARPRWTIEGPVRRFGGALGNVLIILALMFRARGWIGFAGVPIAGLWLAVTLVLWRVYPTLLLELATERRRDPETSPALPELVDSRTLRILAQRLVATPDRCRAACEIILDLSRDCAVPALAGALWRAPAENRSHSSSMRSTARSTAAPMRRGPRCRAPPTT